MFVQTELPDESLGLINNSPEEKKLTKSEIFRVCLHGFIGPVCPLPKIKEDGVEVLTEGERLAGRLFRTLSVITFISLTLFVLEIHNSGFQTAPVTQKLRSHFFSDVESQTSQFIQQSRVESVQLYALGEDISATLNYLQQACLTNAMVVSDLFVCDIIRIDWQGLRQGPKQLPCDTKSMEQMVEVGDREPFGELPTLLRETYEDAETPIEEQITPHFPIYAGWKLYTPLFTGEGDEEAGKLGPLPTINKKLNIIGTALKANNNNDSLADLFSDTANFRQSSDVPRGPPLEGDMRPTEANHHWDILFHCDPRIVEVSFRIKTADKKDQRTNLWWQIDFHWTNIGEGLNFYALKTRIGTGVSFPEHSHLAVILPLFTLFFFFLTQGPYIFGCFFIFPKYIYNIIFKKGTFDDNISHLLDPLGDRVRFMPWMVIFLENFASFATLLSFLASFVDVMSSKGITSFLIGFEQTISAFQFWSKAEGISGLEIFSQFIFGLWSVVSIHGIAMLFFLLRAFDLTLMLPGTAFLLRTLSLALVPLFHFCCIFLIVVFGYAALLHTMFGVEYPQFSTLSATFLSLFLYSFDFSSVSGTEDQVHPFVEEGAYLLQLLLLSYQVVVITILLNMFTTIVINAYGAASMMQSNPELFDDSQGHLYKGMERLLGFEELSRGESLMQGMLEEDLESQGVIQRGLTQDNVHDRLLKQVKDAMFQLQKSIPGLETMVQQERRVRKTMEEAKSTEV